MFKIVSAMLVWKEIFQAEAIVHSAHVSAVRRVTGLDEGNDFTGRCRTQKDDGQNVVQTDR